MLRSADALLRITTIVLLLSGTASSQSKVGTSGGQFLELPTSARSAGMANIGVMLRDGDGYFYNPAVLGFASENGRCHLPLSIAPGLYGSDLDLYSGGAMMMSPSISRQWMPSVGLALDFAYLISEPIAEFTYSAGPDPSGGGSGNEERLKNVRLGANVGFGWSGKVDFGIGLAVNLTGSYIFNYKATTGCLDIGTFLGVPLTRASAGSAMAHKLYLGASYSNLGPDLEFGSETTLPLPKTARLGAAVEFNWLVNGRKRFEVLPAVEYEVNTTDDQSTTKLGLEVTYREFVSARAGHQTAERMMFDHYSFGFSLSTFGFRSGRVGPEPSETGFFRSLVNGVVIELHYAHNPDPEGFFEGTNYFGLGLTF